MADDFKVFEIDDSFDPLEDLHIDVDEEDSEETSDYQLPEFSPEDEVALVEPVQEASVEERMEQLFKGMPGQKMRLLAAVDLCRERISLDDLSTALAAQFPGDKSVYSPARIAELLERAGALSVELEEIEQSTESEQASDAPVLASSAAAAAAFAAGKEGEEAYGQPEVGAGVEAEAGAESEAEAGANTEAEADAAHEALVVSEEEVEETYLVVAPPAITYYTATVDGLTMVDAHMGTAPIVEIINEQGGKYRHVYKAVLQAAAAAGGTTAKQLDTVLEGDPVLEEPRRFSTYFLRKLEEVDALRWLDVWVITDAGRSVLDAEFANAEGE